MAELISPVAIGLISDPPTIVVSYDCIPRDGGKGKRRKRKMPLRDFTDRSNVKRYAFNLRQRHTKYLADVIDVTLEKMLRVIQEIQKGNSVDLSLEIVNKEYCIDPEEDLNKLTPAQLAQRKAVMDESFHRHLVKPSDPNFIYDREVEFDATNTRSGGNDWDEESEREKVKNEPKLCTTGSEIINKNVTQLQLGDASIPESVSTLDRIPKLEEQIEKPNKIETQNNLQNDYDEPTKLLLASFADVKVQPSSTPFSGFGDKSAENDESSSNNDIEEALTNIESGVLDEEEEDFWQ